MKGFKKLVVVYPKKESNESLCLLSDHSFEPTKKEWKAIKMLVAGEIWTRGSYDYKFLCKHINSNDKIITLKFVIAFLKLLTSVWPSTKFLM